MKDTDWQMEASQLHARLVVKSVGTQTPHRPPRPRETGLSSPLVNIVMYHFRLVPIPVSNPRARPDLRDADVITFSVSPNGTQAAIYLSRRHRAPQMTVSLTLHSVHHLSPSTPFTGGNVVVRLPAQRTKF